LNKEKICLNRTSTSILRNLYNFNLFK